MRLVLLILAFLWPAPLAAGAALDAQVAAVERAAPAALARHGAEGAAVAIVDGGRAAWAGGYGIADASSGAPVLADTVFPVASVTKPVTAWALLRLAAEGRIDLDTPISGYVTRWRLPPSEFDASAVTARAILAHAAGLSFGGDPGAEPGAPVPSLEEAAEGLGQEGGPLRLAHPPGAAFRYSSKGYILLELAVEEITGEPFEAYLTREILVPLGMTRSGFDPGDFSRAATGHDWFGRPLPHYELATRAQGGLWASAGDMARFLAAAMPGPDGEAAGRGVIPPEAVAVSFAPFPFTADGAEIGLGYNLSRATGPLVARKSGDRRGYKSIVFSIPEWGTGLVILTNSDRAAAGVFADIACPWSAAVDGDPLRAICGQLYALRNAHFAAALALALAAAALATVTLRAVRRGWRRWAWPPGPRRAAALGALAVLALFWWGFWYTDLPLRLAGYPAGFHAVRFDPWPTALVWVSWGVTLLLAALAARLLAPRALSNSAR
jgi:CubicO group peptidase (beta-lactamase class C family)